MRLSGSMLALAVAGLVASSAGAQGQRQLTVTDAIQQSRLWAAPTVLSAIPDKAGRYAHVDGGGAIFSSPDRTKFAVFRLWGDFERDGVWMEVLVGGMTSLKDAQGIHPVARLFTRADGPGDRLGQTFPTRLLFQYDNTPVWLSDNRRLAFRWTNEAGIIQGVTVDTQTGKVSFATNHPTHVREWAFVEGGRVLYGVEASTDSPEHRAAVENARKYGLAVRNENIYTLIAGHIEGSAAETRMFAGQIWIGDSTPAPARQLKLPNGGDALQLRLSSSPDGSRAIFASDAPTLPSSWDRYLEPLLKSAIPMIRLNAQGFDFGVRAFYVLDLATGRVRQLWNAPAPSLASSGSDLWWSPNGRSVLLAPSFLPAEHADRDGLLGLAAVVVDVSSGSYQRLPVEGDAVNSSSGRWQWLNDGEIVLNAERRRYFVRRHGRWRETSAATRQASISPPQSGVSIQLRQSESSPPALYAVDAGTGEERLILDPTPQLRSEFTLGRSENVQWADGAGRSWRGRLYYPVGYRSGQRYPFVIQTHGAPPAGVFHLYGTGFAAGPNFGINVAQPLANRGIAVLQMEDTWDWSIINTTKEAPAYLGAYEAAIRHFDELGLLDCKRIGISGFSRTGWHVSYALTHSSIPFAAAVVADNLDTSYVQRNGFTAALTDLDRLVGGPPSGDTLRLWIEQSPGFNAERITAPLQIQSHQLGYSQAPGMWEIYSNLRRLNHPAELFFIADVEHGSHGVLRPSQSWSAQERALDWLDFWLTGHEDADPRKSEQYRSWRQMRDSRSSAASR